MSFGNVVAPQVDKVQSFLRLRAFLPKILSLGRGEVGKEIIERAIVAVLPVELLVGAQQQARLRQHCGFCR